MARIASTNIQLAHLFITHVIDRLEDLDAELIESWAVYAMDCYDQSDLHAAIAIIRDVDEFIASARKREVGALFEDSAGVLLHFAHGLSGRRLKLECGEQAYTDGETIYLPSVLFSLPSKKQNFYLYKAMLAFCWAQIRFGSLRHDILKSLYRLNEERQAVFHCLESLRLEACIERELPGLYREIQHIAQQSHAQELALQWSRLRQRFCHQLQDGADSLILAQQLGEQMSVPSAQVFHPSLIR